MISAMEGHHEVVELFMERGKKKTGVLSGSNNKNLADLVAIDNRGRNALMWAAVNGHEKVIDVILPERTNSVGK